MILESSSLLHLRKDQLHIAGIPEPGARYIALLQLDAVSDLDQKPKYQNRFRKDTARVIMFNCLESGLYAAEAEAEAGR